MNCFAARAATSAVRKYSAGRSWARLWWRPTATAEDRVVHSLHAYFLRPRGFQFAIVYEVDRAFGRQAFLSRRVVAIQHGRQIFNMSASFQAAETGLDHRISIPDVPPPESLRDLESYYREMADKLPAAGRGILEQKRPSSFVRYILPIPCAAISPRRTSTSGFAPWRRLPTTRPCTAACWPYVSDFHLLDTALQAARHFHDSPKLVIASVDHAMWFHRSVRVDDGCLRDDSPVPRARALHARQRVCAGRKVGGERRAGRVIRVTS